MKKIAILGILILSGLSINAQTKINQDLKLKVDKLIETLEVNKSQAADPVSLNAKIAWSEDKTQLAVVLKANIFSGWHIYAYTPKDQPFIATTVELNLPEGITPLTDWEEPDPQAYENGVMIYKGNIAFHRYFKVETALTAKDTISTGLYYQACDNFMCFPPTTKQKKMACK